jgi:16S rRNA processing protein RimM
MVLVGTVIRPHGLRGGVIVQPETDFPETRFQLKDARPHGGRLLVAFDGIGSLTDAETLGRGELRVPAEQLASLPPGRFYHHDLLGCEVITTGGDPVGRVVRIEGTGTATVLVVRGGRGEILVPFAEAICPRVDIGARRITVAPPEGLLELNA